MARAGRKRRDRRVHRMGEFEGVRTLFRRTRGGIRSMRRHASYQKGTWPRDPPRKDPVGEGSPGPEFEGILPSTPT